MENFDETSPEFKKFYSEKEEEKVKDLAHDWFYDRLADFTYELEKKTKVHELGILCRRTLKVDLDFLNKIRDN